VIRALPEANFLPFPNKSRRIAVRTGTIKKGDRTKTARRRSLRTGMRRKKIRRSQRDRERESRSGDRRWGETGFIVVRGEEKPYFFQGAAPLTQSFSRFSMSR